MFVPTPTSLEEAQAAAAAVMEPYQDLPRDARVALLGARLDLFAATCLRIRVKDGGMPWPFVLNPIQERFLRSIRRAYGKDPRIDHFRGIRDMIVKPRQLGFSTFIAALFFMDGLRNPGRISVILTHDQKISEELLRTYSMLWEQLPDGLKRGLSLETDSKYSMAIAFPGGAPPSRFLIATEAGHDWRGGVIHNLHASEAAFYKDYRGFKASYLQAVPEGAGNAIFETTGNGQNEFYMDVMRGEAGDSRFRLVFYAWWEHPEYRRPWNPDAEPPLTAEEMQIMARFGLDLPQMAWRRAKILELGPDLFRQEYPAELADAFLTTGRPFFPADDTSRGLEAAKAIPLPPELQFGERVWSPYEPGGSYLLSADTAEGIWTGDADPLDPEHGGADFCAAYVLETRSLRVVATLHGRLDPPEYARRLAILGRRYRAPIAVERNNHGHTVLHALEVSGYPEVYRHLEYDETGTKSFLKPGFPTTKSTRPQILDALSHAIRTGELKCPDPGFWREASTFHRSPTGKPEALPGFKDDRVIGLAIGVYLATLGRGAWGIDGPESQALWGSGPLQAPAPPPVAGGLPPAKPGFEIGNALAEQRQLLRANTCGTCMHLGPGDVCAMYRFTVKPSDPSCPSHYPRGVASGDDPSAPWSGDGGG
jgi:hypothetical protein